MTHAITAAGSGALMVGVYYLGWYGGAMYVRTGNNLHVSIGAVALMVAGVTFDGGWRRRRYVRERTMTFDNEAYMYYVGLASLLGRLVKPANDEDREVLARAFGNVNEVMAARRSPRRFRLCHDGGYVIFED